MKTAQRNSTLDIFKAVAAYLIVVIHYKFPFFNSYVNAFARIGVPFFLLISGYFCVNSIMPKIKHVFKLLLLSECLWLVFNFVFYRILLADATYNWLLEKLTLHSFVKALIIPSGMLFGIDWFLISLLYMYILYYLANKLKLKKLLFFLIPVIMLGLIIGERHVALAEAGNAERYFFNLNVFRAFPFFWGGVWLRENKEKIVKFFNPKRLAAALAAGAVLTAAERYVWDCLGITYFNLYIGIVVMTFGFFVFGIMYPDILNMPFLKYVGENLSMYIYIFHMMVITVAAYYVKNVDIAWIWAGVTLISYLAYIGTSAVKKRL